MAAGRHWMEDALPKAGPPKRGETAPAGELEYIVVDEIADGVAELIIEPWPVMDERGRLVFAQSDRRIGVAVVVADLEALLRERIPVGLRADAALLERPLRTGDVIGARVDRTVLEHDPNELAAWLQGPIVDATHQARNAAKAQYFAAVGPVLSGAEVDAIAEEFFAGGGATGGAA
jgi:hypothetical protein